MVSGDLRPSRDSDEILALETPASRARLVCVSSNLYRPSVRPIFCLIVCGEIRSLPARAESESSAHPTMEKKKKNAQDRTHLLLLLHHVEENGTHPPSLSPPVKTQTRDKTGV